MLDASAKITFPICQDYADCFVFLKEKCMIAVTGQSVMSSFTQPDIRVSESFAGKTWPQDLALASYFIAEMPGYSCVEHLSRFIRISSD